MLIKGRTKSTTHLILESLYNRMTLSYGEKMEYQNQVKGFEGELQFDQLINHQNQTGLVMNDLLLNTKNTSYQMDSLLILNNHINIYEVKNYTGNYTFVDGVLTAESGHIIQNPLDQVNRKKAYLHNLLLNMGYQYTVSAYVAYVNPNFYIYLLSPNESILFHGQLSEHFQQLSLQSSKKLINRQNRKIAEYIIDQHNENFRPNHLPDYSFHDMKKGITCSKCSSFHFSKTRSFRICTSCGDKEKINNAILRSIHEFQLLFPEMKITVENIVLWCGDLYNKYRVQRLLTRNFTLRGKGTSSYYN